jgi:transposase
MPTDTHELAPELAYRLDRPRHWSRELQTLGHNVRLIPPAYVKPYVKRQKNDAADAEAICEAVTRANMRFVPTKTAEQQSGLVLHRTQTRKSSSARSTSVCPPGSRHQARPDPAVP